MTKNEHAIFQDIPLGSKNGTFHSAVLTTYAIDLIEFDCHLLNTLHRKQVTSINILADCSQADKAVEFANPMFLTHVGREYSLSSIKATGAFHPKINFFAGYDAALVLIGSGNLTVAGQGKNHEVFTGFMIDGHNDLHRPLIEECWHYLLSFKDQLGDFERRRLLSEIPENCNFLDNRAPSVRHQLHKVADGLQAALLYPEKGLSIMSQLAAIVPVGEVTKISVISPYFDEDGATLLNLLTICGSARMDVLIQRDCSLPPCKMKEDPRITFFDFDETKRGMDVQSKYKGFERLAHAKILLFETGSTRYCVTGSANATKAGLGTMDHRGANEELCVLYVSEKIDFLGELGLKAARRHRLAVKDLHTVPKANRVSPSKKIIKLHSAWYESGDVRMSCDSPLPEGSTIVLQNGEETLSFNDFETSNCLVTVRQALGRQSWICYVNDIYGNCISNKMFVNNTDELDATNPSPTVRELNRIVYRIESDGFDGLDVADMLSDVMFQFLEEGEPTSAVKIHPSATTRPKDTKLPDIKYDASLDNDDATSVRHLPTGRVSRLVECIEESIRKKLWAIDDSIKDEEELANAENGRQRTTEREQGLLLSKTNVRFCGDQASRLLKRLRTLIGKRGSYCCKNSQSVSSDDLCLFSLTMFASTEICYLNRFMYEFNCSDRREESRLKKELLESLDSTMEHEGLDTLMAFSKFCGRFYKDIPSDKPLKRAARKVIKYALLFAAAYFRFAVNQEFKSRKLTEAMTTLVKLLGMPDRAFLEKEFQPLIEKYDHIFELRDIERTLTHIAVTHHVTP